MPAGQGYTHLSRETIARAALDLIDRHGPGAFTLRNLAAELGVGTSTLNGYACTCDDVVCDVVQLLFMEIDDRLGRWAGL